MAVEKTLHVLFSTLDQFYATTTLHGYILMLELKSKTWQRLFWLIVLLVTNGFAVYVVLITWWNFTDNPTIESLDSQDYPIAQVPFPAVAICSMNKISKNASLIYARNMNLKLGNTTNEKNLQKKLRHLGSLIDIDIQDQEDAVSFQEQLDLYDAINNEPPGNVNEKLRILSPKCEEFLLRCQWEGLDRPCEQIFYHVATADGYCCMFNFVRSDISKSLGMKTLKTNATGSARGLMVLLNATQEDYFYSTKNTVGFSVQIFNSKNFPDATTGNFGQFILNPSKEVYMKLVVNTVESTDSVRQYSPQQRKCFFDNEVKAMFGDYYSYPNCLTKCKLRSILALCNCVPYYAPADFRETNTSDIQCTLNNIVCMERYEVTWNTYKPQVSTDVKGFERELEDSLSCPDCLPLCSNTLYSFETTTSPLQPIGSQRTDWGLLEGIKNLTDLSLLRVYFSSPTCFLYKKDVVMIWYEIVGSFGGLLSLCLGCSIISAIEILYCILVVLPGYWRKYPQVENA